MSLREVDSKAKRATRGTSIFRNRKKSSSFFSKRPVWIDSNWRKERKNASWD